jgi:predicted RNA-binding Zn-ribbon protein involved in translation (DUF1610 family)
MTDDTPAPTFTFVISSTVSRESPPSTLGRVGRNSVVDPRYTSQTCHNCLHIHPVRGESYRSGKKFACGHCGWDGDADLNGAKNISAIGAVVNQPRGSGLSCKLDVRVRKNSEYVQLSLFDVSRAFESSHLSR